MRIKVYQNALTKRYFSNFTMNNITYNNLKIMIDISFLMDYDYLT